MSTPAPPSNGDTRNQVTEHAFRVASGLLGRELATPWRRLAAIVVDGFAVVVLANAPGIIFGVAVASVLLRASIRPAAGGVIRRSARVATRAVTAVVIFAVAVSLWETVSRFGDDDDQIAEAARGLVSESGAVQIAGLQGLITGAQVVAVVRSRNEAEAREALTDLVDALREIGVSDGEIMRILEEVETADATRPWIGPAVDSAAADLAMAARAEAAADSIRVAGGDAALSAYVEAVGRADSLQAAALRAQLPTLLAANDIAALEARIDRETERVEALEEALEEEREGRGILAAVRTLLDDLGLGFGWGGLYFTAFTVLWRGQTPGKRLTGIRAARLDGVPIGWWNAFERFAGYAAGLATGLLGFIQIFWDRNRQGIQDKIAGTVVVRE